MKFLVALAVFALAFAEEVKIQPVALAEPTAPFIRDGILRSLVPPVKVAEPDRQEISGDSIVQFANEAQELRDPKTVEILDIPVKDRIQFAEESSPQNSLKIVVPQVLENQNDPGPEDLRFQLLGDLINVEPVAAPDIPTEYDAPISEDLKVKFVNVPSQIEPMINVPQPSDVQYPPVSDDLRDKIVDDQEWAVPEDFVFYGLLPQAKPEVIDVPQALENDDSSSVSEDLRVKFVDAPLNSVDSASNSEDLKLRFADAALPNVEPIRVATPQDSEIPIASESEDLRVQFVDEPLPQNIPVKNADLSKPGKVYPNPMWR